MRRPPQWRYRVAMKSSLRSIVARVLLLILLVLRPLALHAQTPTKIFVASFGNDANDGSRGSPKRNFQNAHDAIAAGGQIVVLDTAGYGALTITKSLAVTVPPGVNGFVTVTGSSANGITINATATGSVSLRGLIVEGPGGGGSNRGNGILVNSVGNLAIDDCTVRNFYEGIYVNSITATKCYFRRCTVRGCGYGLDVENNAGVAVTAIATGCRLEQSGNTGVYVIPLSNPAGSSADLTLIGCVIAGSNTGIFGAHANALVRVDNCRITGNNNGVTSSLGAQILSRGNNTLENNPANNAFTGPYSAK